MPSPAARRMPSRISTVFSGRTAALPRAPICLAFAASPITAIDLSLEPQRLSRTKDRWRRKLALYTIQGSHDELEAQQAVHSWRVGDFAFHASARHLRTGWRRSVADRFGFDF